MKEETKKVLKMVEEGKITAEEGEKLIDALSSDNITAAGETIIPSEEPKFLKVHVIDNEDGKDEKVDVCIPISLVEVGLKFGMMYGPHDAKENLKDIDFKAIVDAVKQGAKGKIVDVKSSNATVEVFVE